MSFLDLLFSWHSLLPFIFKMIRRLFSTLFGHSASPPSAEIFPTSNTRSSPLMFQSQTLESLSWLHALAPCFPVKGDNITVIYEPNRFYETIVSKCATAKTRIILASLYLGVGKLESQIITAMHDNLRSNQNLKINVLLDFTRGTRGDVNSKSMLMPLVKESKNFNLSLYHTPALRGLTKKIAPPRWNELVGLQHMKLYLFDNSVIISGANLSNDYFTNRQDRYIMIEDKGLADFYSGLVQKVQEFSLQIRSNNDFDLHPEWRQLPYEGTYTDFAHQASKKIFNYFNEVVEKQAVIYERDKEADTWIFPLIEMGQLGIHHDSIVTRNILQNCLENSKLKLASGYFNLTQEYMDTIIYDCHAKCSILMAHPNANGFQGAKGPAGGIPSAYTLIARKFYEKLLATRQDNQVSLYEFEKPGWTYHAKGLWYYLPDCDLPSMTLIGSSNFGERSVNRDLETQICVVTSNKALQTRLQEECDNLYNLGSTAEHQITNRPVPLWVKAVVGLFKNFF